MFLSVSSMNRPIVSQEVEPFCSKVFIISFLSFFDCSRDLALSYYFSSRTANVLTEAGKVQRGDRVIVILPRLPEWWLLNIACLRTGNFPK